jgi:hypothetical protein
MATNNWRLDSDTVAPLRGLHHLLIGFPGFTPRALCFRALRAL